MTEKDLDRHFSGKVNIGVLLGEPSNNLIDLDLDSVEAIALAPSFLPNDTLIFGRPGKPRSHYLVRADPCPKTKRFKDVDGKVLVELRSAGCQTVFPPSIHPTGEKITFDAAGPGEPKRVEKEALGSCVHLLAVTTLFARHWPEVGSRRDAALALSGFLLRRGLPEDVVERVVEGTALAAGDDEAEKRAQTVKSTVEQLEANGNATGRPTLAELVGEKVVVRAEQWLKEGGLVPASGSKAKTGGRAGPEYRCTPDGLVWDKPETGGFVPILLANFTAHIVGDVVHDDGVETQQFMEIEAKLDGRIYRFTIPASRFSPMNWVIEHLGPRAILEVGFGLKERARVAIQKLSVNVERRVVYAHTGWKKIEDEWLYLHAGGGIGPNGAVHHVQMQLEGALSKFRLPDPPDGDDLVHSIEASLALLELGPDRLVVPLLAAVYRAVLGPADFTTWLAGRTGGFKSSVGGVVQSHWGPGFDWKNLPGSWSSTANSLEALLFFAKDCLLVIDDFAPTGSQFDIPKFHREADRVLRAQGNRSGRGRLRHDGAPRPVRAPRGLALGTGEDIPRGQSLRARLFTLEIQKGDIDTGALSRCQEDAERGVLASAMAGFLHWLAPQYQQVLDHLQEQVRELRAEATQSEQHTRTPEIVANLAIGVRYFLDFARDAGALSAVQAKALWGRCWSAIGEAAEKQAEHLAASDPVERFLKLLGSALTSGQAHVASIFGACPLMEGHLLYAAVFGWRQKNQGYDAAFGRGDWMPQGERVGWVDGDDLYLDPAAAYKAAQKMAGAVGDGIMVGERTLSKRLCEAGVLASRDEDRKRLTVRRTLEGARRDVLHLRKDSLIVTEPPEVPQPAQDPASTDASAVSGDSPGDSNESPQGTVSQQNRLLEPDEGGFGTVGTVGTVSETYKAQYLPVSVAEQRVTDE